MNDKLRMVYVLTQANLKSRYRNTWYGFLWVVLNPILILAVQAFAFSIIFKIQHHHYVTFLMSGLLPWLFIVQSVEMCTGMFVSHAQFIKNIPVSPVILLMTQILDNLINFLLPYLLVVLAFVVINKIQLNIIFLMWLPIISMTVMIASMCLALASVNVVLRDLKFVTSFIFSLLFYLTPIFYPARFIPNEYKFILDVNLFYYILEPFQLLMSDEVGELFFKSVAKSFGVSFFFLFLSVFVWKKFKKYLVMYA